MRGAPCLICGQPGATTAYFWTGGRDTHLYAAFDALWEQERGSKESRGSVGSPPSQKNGPPHRHGEAQAREEPDRRGRDLDRRDGGRHVAAEPEVVDRSEERRVGKECRSRWSPY